MRPLTILYFTSARERGGAEQHLLSLIAELNRESFKPLVACPRILADQIQDEMGRDVELFPIEPRGIFRLRAAATLGRLVRSRRVEILHSHLSCSSRFASPIGHLAGVAATVETPHVNEGWRRGWMKERFFVDRLAGRCVDAFIAVSRANARYLAGGKGLPPQKIRVIPNGIDPRRFDPKHRAPEWMRRRIGLEPGDPLLVCVARLEQQKGHRVLLDAMPHILTEFPRVRLAIVGDGSLRDSLESHSRAIGLGEAVWFAGRQKNVADWLALAQVAVLPSLYEGLPLAALEALAAEKPLVATAVDGTPEVVLDNKTGLTVPPGDPRSLAAAILQMLRNPARAQAMARAGRKLVAQKFTIERQARDTESLYRELWEQHATRRSLAHTGRLPAQTPWRNEAT